VTGHVEAINCTNCGAGLSVLGGGRVVTQVCSYCGARLDATDAYRVLSVLAGMVRPDSPFRLGMKGLVEGVEHVIIGTLGYVERHGGREWRWVDHMLYSPTHGYAWLTVEDGHTLLTHKVRDWPDGAFLTADAVERAEARPTRVWRGRAFRYYATSTWQVDFVEGEFTWRPERGQRGGSVSLMPTGAASEMLVYADGSEREIEVTRYFPQAARAFGAEAPRRTGTHPLQPYAPALGKRFYGLWFAAMTAAALILAVGVTALSGSRETLFQGTPAALSGPLTFEVSQTGRPVRVELFQGLSQAWAEYEVEVTDPTGTPVAETGRAISYYSGGSGEDSWTEGSRFSTLTFAPTVPGRYALDLSLAGAETGADRVPLRVTVQDGRGRSLWAWLAAGLFGAALAWTASSGLRHRAKRWAGSDWSEED
jgi:hypothetical protein